MQTKVFYLLALQRQLGLGNCLGNPAVSSWHLEGDRAGFESCFGLWCARSRAESISLLKLSHFQAGNLLRISFSLRVAASSLLFWLEHVSGVNPSLPDLFIVPKRF